MRRILRCRQRQCNPPCRVALFSLSFITPPHKMTNGTCCNRVPTRLVAAAAVDHDQYAHRGPRHCTPLLSIRQKHRHPTLERRSGLAPCLLCVLLFSLLSQGFVFSHLEGEKRVGVGVLRWGWPDFELEPRRPTDA